MHFRSSMAIGAITIAICCATASPVNNVVPVLKPQVRVINACYITEDRCACSALSNPNKCYDATGVDEATGHLKCTARNCQTSHACDCNGSLLCKREEVTRQAVRLLEGTSLCTKQTVTGIKATVLEGENVPTVSLDDDQLAQFNATHCSCSPKSLLYDSITCLDYDSETGGQKICTTRQCNIKATDMTCDAGGSSLCERVSVETTAFVSDGPVQGTENVRCHQETLTNEVPKCVSSCPPMFNAP